MLYLVGLGLGGKKDITVRGLEVVRAAGKVFLENYTSVLIDSFDCSVKDLEEFYGREVILADRDLMEQGADDVILSEAIDKDVAVLIEEFYGREVILADRDLMEQGADDVILSHAVDTDVAVLVVGDPLSATTHTDLMLRAKEKGIECQVINNASILTAIAVTGLQLYNFGETVSIPLWTETWRPDSFIDRIVANLGRNLHTLCLLDIKVKEPNLEAMAKGKIVFDPPRFMSVAVAAQQLLEAVKNRAVDESPLNGLSDTSQCVGVARLGSASQRIVACDLLRMTSVDLGPPLHSMVVVGHTPHPLEVEYLKQFNLTENGGDR